MLIFKPFSLTILSRWKTPHNSAISSNSFGETNHPSTLMILNQTYTIRLVVLLLNCPIRVKENPTICWWLPMHLNMLFGPWHSHRFRARCLCILLSSFLHHTPWPKRPHKSSFMNVFVMPSPKIIASYNPKFGPH